MSKQELISCINESRLQEKIKWAITPYPNGLTFIIKKTPELNVSEQRKLAQEEEKKWGNLMINQKNNPNWTTLLGENLVFEVLRKRGENPRKPKSIEGYLPDWETDYYIYEVKTRNWTTTGTAGEKVFGTMYKYSDIPKVYKKPLRIVCVAYQEYELTNGNTKIFGKISDSKQQFLTLAKSFGIEYIKFSDLINYQ